MRVVRVLQQLLAMRGRGADGRHAGRVVLIDAMRELEIRFVFAFDDRSAATAACDFVRHSDRAMQRRP